MNSNPYMILYLKQNISMRVICLVWEDLSTYMSNNGKAFNPEEPHIISKCQYQSSGHAPSQPSHQCCSLHKRCCRKSACKHQTLSPWMQIVLEPVMNLSIRQGIQYWRGSELALATDITTCSLLQLHLQKRFDWKTAGNLSPVFSR